MGWRKPREQLELIPGLVFPSARVIRTARPGISVPGRIAGDVPTRHLDPDLAAVPPWCYWNANK